MRSMTSRPPANSRPDLPPAPGAELHASLDFANTLQSTPSGPVDRIGDSEQATAWFLERRLLPEGAVLGDPCTARLHTLRAELRTLLGAMAGHTEPPLSALAAVNVALTAAPTAEPLAWDAERGLHRTPLHPADHATDHLVALLAADAAALLTGPDAEKLSSCGAPPCSRFLLRTHASRQWCSVRCGDRVRAARAYSRRTRQQV
jgi:predicted RNA-binding Zn ribbon-like protein